MTTAPNSDGTATPTLRLSKTQRKMLDILADGLPKSKPELRKCLYDTDGDAVNIRAHIYAIRRIVRQYGLDVLCEIFDCRTHYRLIKYVDEAAIRAMIESSTEARRGPKPRSREP